VQLGIGFPSETQVVISLSQTGKRIELLEWASGSSAQVSNVVARWSPRLMDSTDAGREKTRRILDILNERKLRSLCAGRNACKMIPR
jgi:hypothetical protein